MLQALDWQIGGATLRTWGIALGVVIVTLLALYLCKKLITLRLKGRARRANPEVNHLVVELLKRTNFWFLLLVSVYVGARIVLLPPMFISPLRTASIIAFFLQMAIWGNSLITYWLHRYRAKMVAEDAAWLTTVTALSIVSRIILWAAVALMAFQNLGLHVETLIAGLGVGGIAVALAVQNILGDLFASLSIVMDKPFLIGDSITIDQLSGTVEHVGLKSTRIRSMTGEQLIISNSDMLKSRIRNFKRMEERRAAFTLGVTYDTDDVKLAKLPDVVKSMVEELESTRFERAHFKEIGPYSLIFEVVYWVTTPDYQLYMNIQQAINLALIRRLREEGIQLAFPTQAHVPGASLLPAAGGES